MDASRRPGSLRPDPDGAGLDGSAALAAALAALDRPVSTFAVGLSGGPDSVALARCAAHYAQSHRLPLLCFHVDHGLSAQAAAWTRASEQVGAVLGVPVHVARVSVDMGSGDGIESAARDARYLALAEMAKHHGAGLVLLAHHQDDVAETVLHRLLRGSGVDGVRGMRASFERHGASFLRPWLALPRAPLLAQTQAWAAHHGIALADDPTNLDARYARGALRRDVLPAIAVHWPGYRATLTRFARQAESATEVLREVAASDLAAIGDTDGGGLRLAGLLALSEARQALVLRAWLASRSLALPSEARLNELLVQLRTARSDRQIAWPHEGYVVRRYRDQVMLAKDAVVDGAATSVDLVWRGDTSVAIDAFGGVLHFEPAGEGIDPAWLQAGGLAICMRRGGERLRLQPGGPSRTLKNLYQELGIPQWERNRLPLVYRDEQLVYAAGLGADVRAPHSAPGVRLRWVPGRTGVALPA